MTDTERLHKLFEVIRDYVLASGGDGDGWNVSLRYAELASAFQSYEQGRGCGSWFTTRLVADDKIAFYNNQEAVIFLKTRDKLPNKFTGDIIVEIR